MGPDQRVQFMNAEAERLTGWTNREAVGRPVDEVLKLVAEDTRRPRELDICGDSTNMPKS